MNEFISFWIETRVDGSHRFDTFIDFLNREWYTCPANEHSIIERGQYDACLSDKEIEDFVKDRVNESLATGRI